MNCDDYKAQYTRFWNALPKENEYPTGYQEWYSHERECCACQEWSRKQYCLIRGINPNHHCCLSMAYYAAHPIRNDHQGPNRVIDWYSAWDEYRIPITYDGYASTLISFCPWCGRKLRDSKQKLWYDTLYRLGYTDPGEQEIPEEFNSDKWWRDKG
jgi:hypothetical protein